MICWRRLTGSAASVSVVRSSSLPSSSPGEAEELVFHLGQAALGAGHAEQRRWRRPACDPRRLIAGWPPG